LAYVLVRNSGCYLIAASSNNLVKAGYANLTSADSPNACPRDELSYALSAAKNISQKSAARGLSMSQDRPSPLRYSIVSSRAGSLPACLNVTDDSEPSVWFSLEGLSLRTRVAHDETALFLSNTTFSPDGMLGSTAGVPQSASTSAMHSGIAISPRSVATIRPVTLTN
jgi:hypothetical protein